MGNRPTTHISQGRRQNARPKLIIIDDQPVMLGRFVQNFEALGYDVTGVLVAHASADAFFAHGRVDKAALAANADLLKTKGNAWSSQMHNDALEHFDYGVKSKTQLRELLLQLKPDFILSDERMRLDRQSLADEATMRADDNVICGSDVMNIAKELCPNAPRAIHTAIYDEVFEPVPAKVKAKAKKEGHMVFAKDDWEDDQQPQALAIHNYFVEQARNVGIQAGK